MHGGPSQRACFTGNKVKVSHFQTIIVMPSSISSSLSTSSSGEYSSFYGLPESAINPPSSPSESDTGGSIISESPAAEPSSLDASGTESDNDEPESRESLLQKALTAVKESGLDNHGNPKYSLRTAAKDFGVPRSTLTGRWHGAKPKKDAHDHQKHFTPEQEDILVDWIRTLGRRGVPMTLSSLRDFASGALGKPVGENWPSRFIMRHPEIKVIHLIRDLHLN